MKNWNYASEGRYFITICIKNRDPLFGEISNQKMILNELGQIVDQCWIELPLHYSNLQLGAHVIMPDHLHGIMIITHSINNSDYSGHGLSEFIRALKTFSARKINELNNAPGRKIWQSGYYDRVIRNEKEYGRIEQYIYNNPLNWKTRLLKPH